MAYAELDDVKARITRTLTEKEEQTAETLIVEASAIVDAYNKNADEEIKKIVVCRMVFRAMGDDESLGLPIGTRQGTVSALGYSQTWTMGTDSSVGELYLTKTEKKLLGVSEQIGSHSPLEDADND